MSIQYAPDGVTLFYIDATGKTISHNFLEGTPYSDMLDIRGAQLQAVFENKTAAANYTQAVANAQVSEDATRPYPALPDKPRQKVVSDTGAVSYAAFVPPLPDVVPKPPSNAPSVSPATGGLMGALVAGGSAVPDRNAIMYNMISALYRKAFPEATS